MGLLNSLTNVAKAGIAVAISPVALVGDIVTLPASAESGRSPFSRTGEMLDTAGKCVVEAVKPEGDKK